MEKRLAFFVKKWYNIYTIGRACAHVERSFYDEELRAGV